MSGKCQKFSRAKACWELSHLQQSDLHDRAALRMITACSAISSHGQALRLWQSNAKVQAQHKTRRLKNCWPHPVACSGGVMRCGRLCRLQSLYIQA